MAWLTQTLRSSIGKKYVVGAAGFLLCLYLVVHLFGNLMLYGGQIWFNQYAETLEGLPGLILIELALAAVFLVHIVMAIVVTIGNWRSAGTMTKRYDVVASKGEKGLSNTSMIWTGLVVVVFLGLHVTNLRFGAVLMGGTKEYGYYGLLLYLFKIPWYAAFYILSLIALALHLWHGVQSVSRTFGFQHAKYFPAIFYFGRIFAIVITLGFVSIPLYVMFGRDSWEEEKARLVPVERERPGFETEGVELPPPVEE